MKLSIVLAAYVSLWVSTPIAAPVSPYAGEEAREIKALSTAETKSYLSGEGMGLAKAAELNGYPGPSHVLALGADLPEIAASRGVKINTIRTQMASAMVKVGVRRQAELVAAVAGLNVLA